MEKPEAAEVPVVASELSAGASSYGKVVIQAKRYRHTVGVSAVRDLFGTMNHEGANKGILVSTSTYGPDAYDFIRGKPIELIDGGGLLYYLEQHAGIRARIIFPAEV